MIFDKISIFLPLTLSTIYASVSAHEYNQYADPDHDCVCFGSRPQDFKVPQIITPNQGLERLVLFIYRDAITNETNIYTPNLETQNLIPDLTFRDDDELTLLYNETIGSIFIKSPHKTHVPASRSGLYNLGKATKSITIDVVANEKDDNPPNVHKVDNERSKPFVAPEENSDKRKNNVPSTYININQIDDQRSTNVASDIEFQENLFKSPFNAPSNYINVNQVDDQKPIYVTPTETGDKWIGKVPYNYVNVNQIDDQLPLHVTLGENNEKWEHNVPSNYANVNQINGLQPIHDKPKGNSGIWIDNIPSNYVNVNIMDDQKPIYATPTGNSDKRKHTDPSDYENVNQIDGLQPIYDKPKGNSGVWIDNIPSNYINVNIMDDQQPAYITPAEHSDKWKHNVASNYINMEKNYDQRPKDIVHDIEFQENQYIWPYNVPADYTQYLKQIIDQQHRGIVPVQSPFILKHLYNSPAHTQQKQGQFSEWILKQIKTINNHKHRGNPNIDVNTIGNSILGILYENGMYVTDEGVLIDAYGTELDFHILSLRPILIGDTVHLDNILQWNGELFQNNLSYIEAILVATPQKILGVVPTAIKSFTDIWKSNPKTKVNKMRYEQIPRIPSALNYLPIDKTSASNSKDRRRQNKNKTVKTHPFLYVDKVYNKQDSYDPEHYDEVSDPRRNPKKQNISLNQSVKKTQNKKNKTNRQKHDTKRRSHPDQRFYQGPEVRPSENPADDELTKRVIVKDLSSLDRGENYFNNGIFLLPNMGIFNEPVGIMSKSQDVPIDFLLKTLNNAAGSRVPGLMSDSMGTLLRRENIPITNAIRRRSYIAGGVPISVSPETNEYSARKRKSDLNKILTMLSHKVINTPHVPKLPNNRRASIETDPTMKLPSRKVSQKGNILHQILQQFRHSNYRTQYVPDPDFLEHPEFQSRNGLTVPKEVGNANNNEQVPASLVGDDDDDDDDGDFRIIGGHAATGSGTPLSNKGRSGQLY